MPQKIDHRKLLKSLYTASRISPALVEVPPMNYLMIDGTGRPSEPDFEAAAGALFPVAYTLKFMLRAACGVDYHVMPMEVIWRVNRKTKDFAWTMLLMQPDLIAPHMLPDALAKVAAKGAPPALDRLRFECFDECLCVQFLHVGPYPGMDAAMEKMIAFAEKNGCTVPGRSTHDIYLNDSRKTKPENLKTIMRLPVKRRARL